MLALIRAALVMLLSLTLLTGVAYPLCVTAVAQTLLPSQANGSLIVEGGNPRGSRLIGQPFEDPAFFWGRPSAATPAYNGAASSGSNFGPTNPALLAAVKARVAALRAADTSNNAPVPIDLVTASASGLDPHISPAAAFYQANRVAARRGLEPSRVRRLVEAHIEGRLLGTLGEPVVNVLALNLALDELAMK